jgi:hypothetical protein
MVTKKEKERIQLLNAELRNLQLKTTEIHTRRNKIINEIETLNQRESAAEHIPPATTSKQDSLKTSQSYKTQSSVRIRTLPSGNTNGIFVGDRVYIKTHVTKPHHWPKNVEWDQDTA